MDRGNQKPSLKITWKLNGAKLSDVYWKPVDEPKAVEQETGAAGSSALPSTPATNVQDQDQEREISASESDSEATRDDPHILEIKQLRAGETGNAPDSDACQTPQSAIESNLLKKRPRGIPSVGAFTVQCENCCKWRLIPTKEKYEEIRENIMERPFVCEDGREWKPEMSCDVPADINQDGSRFWAIDRPGIAKTPTGWQRLIRIRAEGGTKFADVYYVSPTGKRLRSMVELERYLSENPEYAASGINMVNFSFKIPRPQQPDYVRKRPPPPSPLPLSWAPPAPITNTHLNRASSLTDKKNESSSSLAELSKNE
ncbi:methyl-CpG-binding domain-containing protein 2-like [Andrographis paniculata]|uniref:methyl-CpG-binding domain-containing protein 2-like n=1 Tax=Andrographis paniculata TaxID=175694 RepID=UPI0021E6D9F6|nr:methyl-CpG-binding domain-containing protein 2-like [Andrographis paniculata]